MCTYNLCYGWLCSTSILFIYRKGIKHSIKTSHNAPVFIFQSCFVLQPKPAISRCISAWSITASDVNNQGQSVHLHCKAGSFTWTRRRTTESVHLHYNCTNPSQAAREKRKFSVAGGILRAWRVSRDSESCPSSPAVAKDFRLLRSSLVLLATSCTATTECPSALSQYIWHLTQIR